MNFAKFADADYPLYDSVPAFLGTLNSRFNKHASKAAKKFDERITEIDERVETSFFPTLAAAGMVLKPECYKTAYDACAKDLTNDNRGKYALARIPDFQSLIHTSSSNDVPVFSLNERNLREDDIVGVVKENALKKYPIFQCNIWCHSSQN